MKQPCYLIQNVDGRIQIRKVLDGISRWASRCQSHSYIHSYSSLFAIVIPTSCLGEQLSSLINDLTQRKGSSLIYSLFQ